MEIGSNKGGGGGVLGPKNPISKVKRNKINKREIGFQYSII